MGSSFSQQLCCALCERCRRQGEEAANGESGETKPILPTPGATATWWDTQPPTPALKVPKKGSKELQDRQRSADALEENGESCSAADPTGRAEGWETAWNPMDFCVLPADEEDEGEAEDLTRVGNQQEKVKNAEVEVRFVPDAPEAQPVGGTALGAEQEQAQGPGQPGGEGAGITLQDGNIVTLLELSSEAEPGQGCEMEPAGAVGTGREMSPCAVQVAGQPEPCPGAGEGTGRAEPAEVSPPCPQRAELSWLREVVSLLAVQNPPGLTVRAEPEPCATPAVSPEPSATPAVSPEPSATPAVSPEPCATPAVSRCPQWPSAEPPKQQCDLKQGVSSVLCPLCCAEPEGPRELLQQPGAGAICGVGQEGSRDGPAEPQPGIIPQTLQLPGKPLTPVPIPAEQEAESPNVFPLLPEGFGSSGEMEAENAEG